jgi:hypothetical protein
MDYATLLTAWEERIPRSSTPPRRRLPQQPARGHPVPDVEGDAMSVQEPSRSAPRARRRGLHPMWIGGIALLMLVMSMVILIGYGLLGFAWQKQFGIWNVWVGSALAISIVVPLRAWTTSVHKA